MHSAAHSIKSWSVQSARLLASFIFVLFSKRRMMVEMSWDLRCAGVLLQPLSRRWTKINTLKKSSSSQNNIKFELQRLGSNESHTRCSQGSGVGRSGASVATSLFNISDTLTISRAWASPNTSIVLIQHQQLSYVLLSRLILSPTWHYKSPHFEPVNMLGWSPH